MTIESRVPAGIPTGGQFAAAGKTEADGGLLGATGASPTAAALEEIDAALRIEREAQKATMRAAEAALRQVFTHYAPEVAEVHFIYRNEGYLAFENAFDGDGEYLRDDFPQELHSALASIGGAFRDYRLLIDEPVFRSANTVFPHTFMYEVPGPDPVGRHSRLISARAGWPVMSEAFSIIRDRENVLDETMLALTEEDVDAAAEDYFAPGLDAITGALQGGEDVERAASSEAGIRQHLQTIAAEAYLGSMGHILEAVYDRGEVSDRYFQELDAETVTQMYEDYIAPQVDKIEDRLLLLESAGDGQVHTNR